jgi:hypothetical protein
VYPSGHASNRCGRLGIVEYQSCIRHDLVLHPTVRTRLKHCHCKNICLCYVPASFMWSKRCRILNYAVSMVLFRGTPITRYLYTVPYMVALPVHLGHTVAFWRWGPMTSHSKLFRNTLPVTVIGFLTPPIVGFASPMEHSPFGEQLIFTTLLALWFFTR